MWLILWVCLVSLHQASWRQVLTMKQADLTDVEMTHQADPSQDFLTWIRRSSLPLLFSMWRIKVKPTLLPQLTACVGGPLARQLCPRPWKISGVTEESSMSPWRQSSCTLYLFLNVCVLQNNKIVYEEMWCIKTMLTCSWIVHSRVAFS